MTTTPTPSDAERATTGAGRTVCVLIGVDYVGTPHALRGCRNDAENLRDRLVDTGAADARDVRVLLEATAAQIVRALSDAVNETWTRGDVGTLFVTFSGHGTWMRDASGDETDGRDECLCPADFETAGVLRDDELSRLFRGARPGTRVRVLADCCHSGTCLDLPYAYVGHRRTVAARASTATACDVDIVSLSGCRDDQTSADAYDARRSEFAGAMTSALLDVTALEPTLGDDAFALVAAMRVLLHERGMPQVPQLCASAPCAGCDVAFFPCAPHASAPEP